MPVILIEHHFFFLKYTVPITHLLSLKLLWFLLVWILQEADANSGLNV